MTALVKLVPNLWNPITKYLPQVSKFHSLIGESSGIKPGGLFNVPVRTIVRIHFPRPSERRRVKRHGWWKRMSTPEGRRVLMNRILKGRFVYSH